MLRYTMLRLLGAIPTLLLVVTLAFLMVHAAPGGPFDNERALAGEVSADIEARYRLDEPLHKQYFRYVSALLRGDFGPSYRYLDHSVTDLISMAMPVSLKLGALAMIVAIIVGVAVGCIAALKPRTLLDRAVMSFALTGLSIPVFVIAPILILIFAVQLNWFPAGWSGSEGVAKYVLPVISLALPQIAYIARLTRASMLDVLGRDFIRTARAQGLATSTIIRVHALKPAMLPVLSYLGPAIAAILTGSVVVEQVFGAPGLGSAFIRGALNRDYTLVLGIVILYATLVILFNLIVDILYAALDPRVRLR